MLKQHDNKVQDIIEEALVKEILARATEYDLYPMRFRAALGVYAELYHAAFYGCNDEVPEGWSEVSNEAQTDPKVSEIRRDLNFIARHLCLTLPSTKNEEDEEDGFKW